MNSNRVVRNYYVLPCCLLLLNLCVEIVDYKAKAFGDPLLRTAAIMAMVLFGGSLFAFLISPALEALIRWARAHSRSNGGALGELLFLVALGLLVFWLYYRVYNLGPQSILPADWRNPPLR
ncbi:hypothetical protein GALL_96670 [mine drainage metagenome]|uniref:Uncharacterized protein n=1 Tax=mine drainage metagenome TaxID=410659 RepID=A0A1J5T7R2_9ZZZZ